MMLRITISMLSLALLEASPGQAAEGREAQDKDLQRFREAIGVIGASRDTRELLGAMKVLREGFPASRPVLHESAARGSITARCFAIQVLGEQGDAGSDLHVVTPALRDERPKVRLSAVMALRRLGKDGYEALTRHLPAEKEANVRKMAVRTLQEWGTAEAVPLLVRLLKAEKEKAVRNFIVRALEALAKRKLGDDQAGWDAHLEALALGEQARTLVAPEKQSSGGK